MNKLIYTRHTDAGGEVIPEATLFMYSDGDKIYYYFEDYFHVLHDFSAMPGDTMEITVGTFANFYQIGSGNTILETQTLRVRVESVGMATINGEDLRIIEYSDIIEDIPLPIWGFDTEVISNTGNIIERIGNTKSGLFGESLAQVLYGFLGMFRCYEDPDFFYQNPDFDLPCDYLLISSTEELKQSGFQLFPNPTSDFIFLKNRGNSADLLSIEIINLEGKKILEQHQVIHPNEMMNIDVSGFRAGIYLLRVSQKESTFVRKIIISPG